MKKFTLVRVAMFVFSTSVLLVFPAHAGADTMFAKLRAQYDQGTRVDFMPLIEKVDAGRCFLADVPDAPIASALSASNEAVDDGPLSTSGESILTLSATAEATLAPNYFETPSVTATSPALEPRLPLNLIDARTYQIRLSNLASLRFRAVGSLIVALGRSAYGDETAMCYYFKIH